MQGMPFYGKHEDVIFYNKKTIWNLVIYCTFRSCEGYLSSAQTNCVLRLLHFSRVCSVLIGCRAIISETEPPSHSGWISGLFSKLHLVLTAGSVFLLSCGKACDHFACFSVNFTLITVQDCRVQCLYPIRWCIINFQFIHSFISKRCVTRCSATECLLKAYSQFPQKDDSAVRRTFYMANIQTLLILSGY